MDITHIGHSCFKLKGKQVTVITDPYTSAVGLSLPDLSAEVVTVSHDHFDHNNTKVVKGTAKRENPMILSNAGEYEVMGVSIFGYSSFHDDKQGQEKGKNIVFSIIIEGVTVVHLGDLGHELDDKFIESLGTVDVLLCPVGGEFTIDSEKAVEVIKAIEPSYVIPMHYKTASTSKMFEKLAELPTFLKAYGVEVEPVKSLSVTPTSLPEQTTLVVLA